MRRILIYTLLVVPFFPLGLHAQVTWEECQRKARENYPLIRQAELIRKSEEYTLSNLSKAYLPQLSFTGKASYQSDVTEIPVGHIAGLDIDTPSKDQYQIQAEINQTIWDGGVTSSKKALQRASREVDEQQLETDLYTVKDRVNSLFFGALLCEEQINRNELLQEQLLLNLQQIQVGIEGGVANAADLDAVEVTLLQAYQQKDEYIYSLRAYKDMLSLFTGEDLRHQSLIKPAPVFASAEIRRPELTLIEARSSYLEQQIKGLDTDLRPRFNAFVQGGYGLPGLNMLSSELEPYYIAGVRLSWNLTPWYTRRNSQRLLRNSQQELQLNRETFLLNTRMDFTRQREEEEKQRALMQHDDEIIRLRGNIRKASELKLENGTLTATDLMRDVLHEHEARLQKVGHEIQWLKSLYDMKTTTNN